jgi:hypothetical protein
LVYEDCHASKYPVFLRSHPRLGLQAIEPDPGVPGVEVRLIASVARAKVRILVLATGNSPSWIDPLWTSIVTQRRSEENRTKKEASLTTPFSITNKTNYIWLGYPHKISSVEDIPINQLYLVGGFSPSEKYEFVNWDDDIPNMMGKIKAIFQTTNQIWVCLRGYTPKWLP